MRAKRSQVGQSGTKGVRWGNTNAKTKTETETETKTKPKTKTKTKTCCKVKTKKLHFDPTLSSLSCHGWFQSSYLHNGLEPGNLMPLSEQAHTFNFWWWWQRKKLRKIFSVESWRQGVWRCSCAALFWRLWLCHIMQQTLDIVMCQNTLVGQNDLLLNEK